MQLKTNCYLSSVLDQTSGIKQKLFTWMDESEYTHTHIHIIAIVAIVKNSVSNQINDFLKIMLKQKQ